MASCTSYRFSHPHCYEIGFSAGVA